MKKYFEPISPYKLIDKKIYNELLKYPIPLENIIDVILRAQNKINEGLNPKYNSEYWWMGIPMKEGTDLGGLYENAIRFRFNKIGILVFEEGDHNTGLDLSCITDPYYGIEIKTRQNLQFNNTNDRGRTHDSTKYNGIEDKEHFYILIQQISNTKSIPYTTKVKRIFFGRLSKRDFTNPNGTGAAYLKKDVRNRKCIEIWNDKIGNTINSYQAWLDNDYYEKMIELENEIKRFYT